MHIVLVGLMASGKTTVGELVAAGLRRPFLDCDGLLEDRTGQSAASLAARDGIDALHDLEAAVLLDALAHHEPAVITAAASTIEYDVCLAALSRVFVAWLRVDVAVLAARVRDKRHRPLADDVEQQLREQARVREPLFAAVADVVVDVDALGPDLSAGLVVRGVHGLGLG